MAGRWHVAAVRPGQEDAAGLNLQRQGLRIRMPRQVRVARHARKRHEKRVAFFPGYIFISMDLERHHWRSVNGTFGVRAVIMQGEGSAPCPAGFVEELQAQSDENGIFNGAEGIGAGDAVRVVAGPFAALVGTPAHLNGTGRACIPLQVMRGEVAVTLKVSDLIPASA